MLLPLLEGRPAHLRSQRLGDRLVRRIQLERSDEGLGCVCWLSARRQRRAEAEVRLGRHRQQPNHLARVGHRLRDALQLQQRGCPIAVQ